ncbi:P-loop containing nucleoside triphosphate hydrolase protein [Dendryphion nanum]|uniref:RNA helicase n=1 Tax=Dendryphion nanum TaxID=256645 RepID=A0A9P9IDR1_9PLEO|nr:P-loop containing nucleoside triphosphate hydrolase protein [Dendryphion nanum]
MPTSTARRPSLCLFCSFASSSRARSTALPPRLPTLVPYIQTAHRSGGPGESGGSAYRNRQDPVTRSRYHGRSSAAGYGPFNLLKGEKDIETTVTESLAILKEELSTPELLESLDLDVQRFHAEWKKFRRYIHQWMKQGLPELRGLRRGQAATKLQTRLRYLFYAQLYGERFTKAEVENQKQLADLRYPSEWYPATRQLQRQVHLHVGPTNSGKTYHALKRLEQANRGIYLGPLRLLAHEVYTRLNAKGSQCALVTGEELRLPEGEPNMWSCTVEMAPLNTPLDVAVLDEIQMINHPERGWAWTQAFLGIQAKEIHLCGEARAVPIIKELCALIGDEVHVHNYERLTPLRVAKYSLGGRLNSLEKGDCVVAFSVLGIHALRRQIESKTGRKCAIVYGSLPPETRAQQARLFNEPDNEYDFLVASDAVGMGLNLSIKRVIFESTIKNNGIGFAPLNISELKQIAGRAGRYKSAHQAITQDTAERQALEPADPTIGLDDAVPKDDTKSPPRDTTTVGIVTTLEPEDFPFLQAGMEREPEKITTAGLFPPSLIVERFANYFPPGTPFSYILLRLHEISDLHPRFHLCALKDQLAIADTIHLIRNLSIQERIIICAAPTNVKDPAEVACLQALVRCIADNESGNLLDLPIPLEVLDEKPTAERSYLFKLEQLHKMLVLYLWLSYRFPNVLISRPLANYTKKLVEDAIEQTLSQFSYTEKNLSVRRQRLREAAEKARQLGDTGEEGAIGTAAERDTKGMPQEMQDVLEDTRSFQDDSTGPRDEEGRHSTPEVGRQGRRMRTGIELGYKRLDLGEQVRV